MYHNQIAYHKPPCFNLFILHSNLFNNQGSEINKNDIFCSFPHTVFCKNFLPTFFLLSLYILYIWTTYIMVLAQLVEHFGSLVLVMCNCTSCLFIVQNLSKLAPAKGFPLVRDMPDCTFEFSKKMFPEMFLLVVYTFHFF